MSEQAFIDAALSRNLVEPAKLHAALALRTRWRSVAGRLCAAGVDRGQLLEVLSDVTGLEPAPPELLSDPAPVGLPLALVSALGRVGAVPLGYDDGGALLIAVTSSDVHAALAGLVLPRHRVVVALEQDVTLAAGMLEDPAATTMSDGDEASPIADDPPTETLDGRRRRPHEGELEEPAFTVSVNTLPFDSAPAPVDLPDLSVEEERAPPPPLLADPESDPTQLEKRAPASAADARAPRHPSSDDLAFVATEIAGYHVGPLIGRGAGGLVHKATRASDGEEVALKLITPDRSTSPHFMQRAKRETAVQASLRHRNVVAVYAFGQEGDLWYLASELVEGGPLSKKLREAGPLPSALVALLVRDILAGVEYAHHNSVIHRDIKPGNVLLAKDGRAKLADFGLARSLYDPFRTKPGVVMGTPQYMSPEQVGEGETDHRTDFFSIATLAYEMVTGTSPFKEKNPARSMLAVAKGERPPLVDVAPTVLPLLEDTIEHLGARHRDDRPEKAAITLDRLDPLAYAAERLFPDAGARFVEEPRATALRLRREEAKLELARAEHLLGQGAPHVPEAAFAAWRASALDEGSLEAQVLRDRIAIENGYSFGPSEDARALALEDELLARPSEATLLRELVSLYRADGNVPMLVRRLRRLARVCPDDVETTAARDALLGDPMGPFKRR